MSEFRNEIANLRAVLSALRKDVAALLPSLEPLRRLVEERDHLEQIWTDAAQTREAQATAKNRCDSLNNEIVPLYTRLHSRDSAVLSFSQALSSMLQRTPIEPRTLRDIRGEISALGFPPRVLLGGPIFWPAAADALAIINGRLQEMDSALEVADASEQNSAAPKNRKKVAVVHGRNIDARRAMFDFLRSLKLEPKEWSEVLAETRKGTPLISDALDALFRSVQAVVVLMTGDDVARLGTRYLTEDDLAEERDLTPQARPNVLFETGLAFGKYPDRTIIVTLGRTRSFSDIAGRHVVRMDNSVDRRNDLVSRLSTVGCDIDIVNSSDWRTSGNFQVAAHGPDLDDKSSLAKRDSAGLSTDGSGPNINALTPRLCFVRQDYIERGETLIESDEPGFRAAVVPFRIAPTQARPAKEAVLSARIEYLALGGGLLHRVDYGFWVGEDFNFTEIAARDTKELVLALRHSDGFPFAIQDNRHSTTQFGEMLTKDIREDCYADVTIVDEESATRASYSFKLTLEPFSVVQVIAVHR